MVIKNLKAVIFDLDDTLFDTLGQLVEPARKEACQAMINQGLNTSLTRAIEFYDGFFSKGRQDIFGALIKEFGVQTGTTETEVKEAGFNAFYNRDIKERIFVFDGVIPMLEKLKTRYLLFLVTLGHPETQKLKVKMLGIESFFKSVEYVDIAIEKSKTPAFQKILKENAVSPSQGLAVGNRIDSEISSGKSLGMTTILLNHGEYSHYSPSSADEVPDKTINRITDLEEILL